MVAHLAHNQETAFDSSVRNQILPQRGHIYAKEGQEAHNKQSHQC